MIFPHSYFYPAIFLSLILSFQSVDAQRRTAKRKPRPSKIPVQRIYEFSEKEWNAILLAVEQERWTTATMLSQRGFLKLKIENERRQLARLRYIYLYSLAGSLAKGSATIRQLELAANSLVGKILIAPRHPISSDCKKKVNFVCAVEGDSKTLRVTSTNKSSTTIHSFEYFELPNAFDAVRNEAKEAILGGTLTRFEINQSTQKFWIIRLIFSDGFVLSAVE